MTSVSFLSQLNNKVWCIKEPTLPGDVFTLESPPFDGYSSTFDVSFAYHMHGLGMGHLYLKGMNATGDWDDLWSAHGVLDACKL